MRSRVIRFYLLFSFRHQRKIYFPKDFNASILLSAIEQPKALHIHALTRTISYWHRRKLAVLKIFDSKNTVWDLQNGLKSIGVTSMLWIRCCFQNLDYRVWLRISWKSLKSLSNFLLQQKQEAIYDKIEAVWKGIHSVVLP